MAVEQRKKEFEKAVWAVTEMLCIVIGLLLYFTPSIIGRHKANALAIFVFNFFLGWTFLGWVLALVWACTKDAVIETSTRAGQIKEP